MPRLTVRPALRPRSTFGRMPAATTTRFASRPVAVGELDALDAPVAADRRRAPAEQHADAEPFIFAEVLTAVRIELPLHQRRHQVHDGHLAALHLETARGLESEQAAADHDRFGVGPERAHQLARVVERAEREHAVLVEPLDRRHPRRAAGREQQRVVRRHAAIVSR